MSNDGKEQDISEEIVGTLLGEVARLQAQEHNILIVAHFNSRLNAFRGPGTNSRQGDLLSLLAECSPLNIVNCSDKCEGRITWWRGEQKSTIDYVLANEGTFGFISRMAIDKRCNYSVV